MRFIGLSNHRAIRIVFSAFLLVCLNFSFSAEEAPPFDTQVQAIGELIQQNNLTQAQADLAQFWTEHNSDEGFVEAVRQVKDAYWRAGEYEAHFTLCSQIIDAFGNHPLAVTTRVDVITGYIKTKDLAKASELLEPFWTNYHADERFVEYARWIKDAYWTAGDHAAHYAVCDRIINEFPEHPLTADLWADAINGYIADKALAKASEKLEQFWVAQKSGEGFVEAARRIKDEFWKEGCYTEHFAVCERIINEFPDHPLAAATRVDVITGSIKTKDFARASEKLEEFWAHDHSDERFVEYARWIKDAYWTAGDHSAHYAVCERIINEFPDHPLNLAIRADAITGYIHDKDFAAAQMACDQMLARFAEAPMLGAEIYRVAKAYAVGGQTDKAMELHRSNAQQYGGTEYGRWSNVEWILHLIRQKDFAAAQSACSEFAVRYADEATLGKELYILGREFAAAGDRDRGFGQHLYNVEHAKECDHTRWSNVEVVFYYIDQERDEDAEAACLAFIGRYAEHPDLGKELQNMINRYAAAGRITRAESLCGAALQAYPDNRHMIWMQYGLICVYLDQMAQADVDAAFDGLLNDAADNPELARVVNALGRYCRDKYNDTGRAVEFYSLYLKAYDTRADAIDIVVELIRAYLEIGNAELADARVGRLMMTHAEHPLLAAVLNGFGNDYRAYGFYVRSIHLHEAALALNPGKSEMLCAHTGIGQSAARLGDDLVVQAQVKMIMDDYGDLPDVDRSIFVIGEEYYFKAHTDPKTCKALVEGAVDILPKAIQIWWHIIETMPESAHAADAWYFSGAASRKLGHIEDMIWYYQTVVDVWPDYKFNWSAQPLIGWGYENLKRQGKMEPEFVNPFIEEAYLKTMGNYPDGSLTPVARDNLLKLFRNVKGYAN